MSDRHVQIERLLELGRTADAARVLAEAFREAPDDPELPYYAAAIAHHEERTADARRELEQLLARAPGHAEGRVLLVRVLLEEKRFVEAERLLLELLHASPESSGLFALYALLMLLTLHLDKSRGLVNEALRLDPMDPLAGVLDVMLCLAEGDPAGVQQRLAEMIADSPEAMHVAWMTLVALRERGRDAEALEIGRAILRASPDDRDCVEALVDLRARAHWSSWVLRPLQRWGWGASAVLWVVFALGIRAMDRVAAPPVTLAFTGAVIAFCVYTWIQPWLLRRWLRARGF